MIKLFDERKKKILEFEAIARKRDRSFKPLNIPNHLFVQCSNCLSALYNKDLDENMHVCPYCNNHFIISARKRIEITVDENSFKEINSDLVSIDILNMPNYKEKLKFNKKITGMNDAFLSGEAKIDGIKVAIGVLDSTFMMGSMGSVVGEKIKLLILYAEKHQLPLIIFSASGGARMQEGIFSLMQMAKTSAALNKLRTLYISVLTNPTTGGVAASYAILGDINIAEKTSLIGFAGPRVIKQTIRQDLPSGFQTEDFQLEKGQVDLVLERKEIRNKIAQLLKLHGGIKNE